MTVLIASLALFGASCGGSWVVTYDSNSDPTMHNTVLTPDGGDAYTLQSSGGQMNAAALGTNTGGNLRVVFWPATSPWATDSQSCATWTSASSTSKTQLGAALRIIRSDGETRALTVTRNVFMFPLVFNLHTWDTRNSPEMTLLGQVDMYRVFRDKPFPWQVCARVVGNKLEMKGWTNSEPEPIWGDTSHGGSAQVPSDFVYAGKTGWYVGHLLPGGTARFDNLKTWMWQPGKTKVAPPQSGYGAGPDTSDAARSQSSGSVTISPAP